MKTIYLLLFISFSSFAQEDAFEEYRKMREEMFEKLLRDDSDKFDQTALEILKKLQGGGITIPKNIFTHQKLNFEWRDNHLIIFPVYKNDKIDMTIKDGAVLINGLSSKSKKKIKQSIPIIQKNINYRNTKVDFSNGELIVTFIN